MIKYVIKKYGIIKSEGKVIKRVRKSGIQLMFRDSLGLEYPMEKCKDWEELTQKQQEHYKKLEKEVKELAELLYQAKIK